MNRAVGSLLSVPMAAPLVMKAVLTNIAAGGGEMGSLFLASLAADAVGTQALVAEIDALLRLCVAPLVEGMFR